MAMLTAQIPPGMYYNGTPYDAVNRWHDVNLVRWHDGSMRAVGGWERRAAESGSDLASLTATPDTETVRDCMTYRTLAGTAWSVYGSNAALYSIDYLGTKRNITPAGFVGGSNGPVDAVGFGVAAYGIRTYGTPRFASDAYPPATARWAFDMWGENVLASFENGRLYEYVPGAAAAVLVANSPLNVQDHIVTDERIVMCIQNNASDTRMVLWSDRENNTVWNSLETNYAGYYRLQGTGKLLGIYKVQGNILILSETDAHIGTYLGAPYVYGFERIGDECAPLGKRAVAATDRFIAWMSDGAFWLYDGTIKPLPCDILDYISEDMDYRTSSKIWCIVISNYSEIWWFYQSVTSSNDVDSYVCVNYNTGAWSRGRLARTAGYATGAFSTPIMVDDYGIIWNHEQRDIIPMGDVYAMTGPMELGQGDTNMAIRRVFPDVKEPDQVEYTFYASQSPVGDKTAFGPYAYSMPIGTTGLCGRSIFMKITGATSRWSVGAKTRFDVQPMQPTGAVHR